MSTRGSRLELEEECGLMNEPTMKLVFRRESPTSWKVALPLNYGLSWTEALAEINKKLPVYFIKYRPIQRFSYDYAVGQTTIVNGVFSYEILKAHSRRHGDQVFVELMPRCNAQAGERQSLDGDETHRVDASPPAFQGALLALESCCEELCASRSEGDQPSDSQ